MKAVVVTVLLLFTLVYVPVNLLSQQDKAPQDSLEYAIIDSGGFKSANSAFLRMNIENTGDIFSLYSPFFLISEGKPDGTKALVYNGLSPKLLTFKLNNVPMRSFLFERIDYQG